MLPSLRGLLDVLRALPGYDALRQAPAGARIALPDGVKAPLVAAIAADLGRPILWLTAHGARTRMLADQLAVWLGGSVPIAAFPDHEGIFYELIASDARIVRARIAALNLLANPPREGAIVIASTRAAMSLLAPPEQFRHASRAYRVGDRLSPEQIVRDLLTLGYRAEPLADEPGTVTRRGGIVDVFPANDDTPVRIEFFGDEIDSLRRFDPATQRSTERVDQFTLLPATELLVPIGDDSAALGDRLAVLPVDDLSPTVRDRLRRDLDRLIQGEPFPGIECYAGFLGSATIFDYLAPGALVVADEPTQIVSTLEELERQAFDLREELIARRELTPDFPAPFCPADRFAARLDALPRLVFDWRGETTAAIAPIAASLREPPAYGGRVRQVLGDCRDHRKQGTAVVLVTHQSARLRELCDDHDQPAAVVERIDTPPLPGQIAIVHGSLQNGLVVGAEDGPSLLVLADHELFGITRVARPVRRRSTPRERFVGDLNPGDYVVHVEHGVGRYSGIQRMASDGVEREYLVLEYAGADRLFVPTDQADRVSRYVGVGGAPPALHRLGTSDWTRTKGRVRMAVLQMARELLELYAAREVSPGHAFSPDGRWQQELEASFPYVETPDQLSAIAEIKADMERAKPMDRLLCGDVGYGKTEVAVRAAFKAVMDGKQVAVLVPTTVLAQQHFNTFRERTQAFPVKVEMLSRFRTEREQQEIVAGLANGTIDICIGTHRLVQKDVQFKDLGLVIVDEEQRFGVGHKERLKQLRKEVDVLTLTATPIPRTLHMALVGVRDMSTIDTPPEDRLPIKTYVAEYDEGLVREAILREIDRGGQVYFVHNRVRSIYHVANRLAELVPEAAIAVGHGQMPEDQLEQVMLDFAAGRYDVLVCSTIIESGLDLPNVNTIIVHHAERFGLAQLYQLRGRVGRGANRAFAYFTYPKGFRLSEVAEKRLRTIFEASELGAGFQIAMKDLEIRGAGNLLGPEQHGHVAAVGFHLYCQLLADAVKALKGEPVVRPPSATVDLPLDAYLPDSYVEDESSRLSLYQRFAAIADEGELGQLALELQDRFGPPPEPALNLIALVQLKLLAARAGIASVALEGDDVVLRTQHNLPIRRPTLDRRLAQVMTFGSTQARLHRARAGKDWRGLLHDLLEVLGAESPAAVS